jgi:hypothetical protein
MANSKTFFFCIFLFSSYFSLGQNEKYTLSTDSMVNFHAGNKRVYYCQRTANRPKVDGKLNDICWSRDGEWQGDFIQQNPNQAKAPSQQTQVKILYDSDNLYIALKCHDNEPKKISPLMGRRDDYTTGDVAGVALDTYFDKQTAFEFNVTAAGQKIDLMHLGAYQWDTNWDAVWEGKVAMEDSMWTIEMKIPFSQLRFSNQREQVWGMHIWRWIDRLDEEDQWKLIPIDAPAMVYIFGELRGIKDIPKKHHFEIMPFVAARYLKSGSQADRFGYGVDGKAALSSNFTLDYTVLPDFGQVEADPSVLELSTYEVFYDEKRPFFLEGNAILDYSSGNDLLFYSRRIGHSPSYTPVNIPDGASVNMPSGTSILNALKVTGKNKKGFSMGIINSLTSRENAEITTGDQVDKVTIEPFTDYFIGRVRQDFNKGNSYIGGMATSVIRSIKDQNLQFLPDRALVGGVDIMHTWNKRMYFIDFKSFYSNIHGSEEAITRLQTSARHLYQREDANHLTPDLLSTDMSGWGGQIKGGKQSGKFRASGTLSWRSPGVDLNDVGYLRDADLITQRLDFRYQVNKPVSILRNYYFTLSQRLDWTFGGENTNNIMNLHGFFKFKNLWDVHLDFVRNYDRLDTRQLRGGPALRIDPYFISEIFFQTNSNKKVFLGAGADKKWVDRNVAGSIDYTLYLQWKISNRFTLTSRTNYEVLTDNNQYIATKSYSGMNRFIVGKIDRKTLYTTLRAEYFISPEFSLQFYGSPYASIGKFRDIFRVTDPYAHQPVNRYSMLKTLTISDGRYYLDENSDSKSDYYIWNPDFNFQEFRSNFVLRWEYKAGSTAYLVWSHNRSSYENQYNNDILDSFAGIAGLSPHNVFMLKLSYWLSL